MPVGSLLQRPWEATVGCADWQQVQWPASFKSVPFAVATDTRTGGRRIQVHEYPVREWWENEDLGRLRQEYDVQAYVFGDRVDLWAEILFSKCSSKELGLLILPARVPINARCLIAESVWNELTMGRMDFTMRFTCEVPQAGRVPSEVKSAVFLANVVAASASEVSSIARLEFEQIFSGNQAHTGRREAATAMDRVAFLVRRAAAQARVRPSQASNIDFSIKRMQRLSSELADSQRSEANVRSTTAFVKSQRPARFPRTISSNTTGLALRASTGQVLPFVGGYNEGFGGVLQATFRDLQDGAPSPADLGPALSFLVRVRAQQLELKTQNTSSAVSVQSELELSEAVYALARRLSIAQTCLAGIRVSPENQPDASIARNRFLEQIDQEIYLASGSNYGLQDKLRKLRSTVTQFVSLWSRGGSGTKLVLTGAPRPLAVVAANAYGKNKQEDRDRQIMEMNAIRHPLFPSGILWGLAK